MEVKELTVAPVDEALLDAPAGYTKMADAEAFVKAIERAEERGAGPRRRRRASPASAC